MSSACILFSRILGFAIPMLLGTLFQQFYSMADTVIVGRYLSINALAGVGSTAAINFLINGFVIGMSSGFALHGLFRCTLLRCLRNFLCLAPRLACGGLFSDSGLLSLLQEALPPARFTRGMNVHTLFMISLKKRYKPHMNLSRLFAII